jgi:hypothetical protein
VGSRTSQEGVGLQRDSAYSAYDTDDAVGRLSSELGVVARARDRCIHADLVGRVLGIQNVRDARHSARQPRQLVNSAALLRACFFFVHKSDLISLATSPRASLDSVSYTECTAVFIRGIIHR